VDYERILKPFMLKQWNEKKLALKAFDYFDFLSPEQVSLRSQIPVNYNIVLSIDNSRMQVLLLGSV